jgi:hypothetical protein
MASQPNPDLVSAAERAAKAHGVPPDLFRSLIQSESSFNPEALGAVLPSGERAVGIAQFLPSTARELGINPRDPYQALDASAKYLRQLFVKQDVFAPSEQRWLGAVGLYKGYGSGGVTPDERTEVAGILKKSGYDVLSKSTALDVSPTGQTDELTQSVTGTRESLDSLTKGFDWLMSILTPANVMLGLVGLLLLIFGTWRAVKNGR